VLTAAFRRRISNTAIKRVLETFLSCIPVPPWVLLAATLRYAVPLLVGGGIPRVAKVVLCGDIAA
jgi:hypothetical protein